MGMNVIIEGAPRRMVFAADANWTSGRATPSQALCGSTAMGESIFERFTVAGSILLGAGLALFVTIMSVAHYISQLAG